MWDQALIESTFYIVFGLLTFWMVYNALSIMVYNDFKKQPNEYDFNFQIVAKKSEDEELNFIIRSMRKNDFNNYKNFKKGIYEKLELDLPINLKYFPKIINLWYYSDIIKKDFAKECLHYTRVRIEIWNDTGIQIPEEIKIKLKKLFRIEFDYDIVEVEVIKKTYPDDKEVK